MIKQRAASGRANNAYLRLPVLAKLTFIYSLMSERVTPAADRIPSLPPVSGLHACLYLLESLQYRIAISDNTLGCLSSTYQVLPMRMQMYLGNNAVGAAPEAIFPLAMPTPFFARAQTRLSFSSLASSDCSRRKRSARNPEEDSALDLEPGFRPTAYGGDRLQMSGTYTPTQQPGVVVQFGHSEWGGNVGYGNTPGSLCHTPFWLPQGSSRDLAFNWNYPVMYQNDWFNLDQTYTPLNAPGTSGIARWVLSDSFPVPVAYSQLVIKGLSKSSTMKASSL